MYLQWRGCEALPAAQETQPDWSETPDYTWSPFLWHPHPAHLRERNQGKKTQVVEKRRVHGGWFERRIRFYTGTFPVENDAWAAAAERLVCCCGHDVAVLKRWWHNSSSYQTADVCHVWHQICAVLISDLPHASIIKVARIATCSLGGKN